MWDRRSEYVTYVKQNEPSSHHVVGGALLHSKTSSQILHRCAILFLLHLFVFPFDHRQLTSSSSSSSSTPSIRSHPHRISKTKLNGGCVGYLPSQTITMNEPHQEEEDHPDSTATTTLEEQGLSSPPHEKGKIEEKQNNGPRNNRNQYQDQHSSLPTIIDDRESSESTIIHPDAKRISSLLPQLNPEDADEEDEEGIHPNNLRRTCSGNSRDEPLECCGIPFTMAVTLCALAAAVLAGMILLIIYYKPPKSSTLPPANHTVPTMVPSQRPSH